jgi:hypothetical protein
VAVYCKRLRNVNFQFFAICSTINQEKKISLTCDFAKLLPKVLFTVNSTIQLLLVQEEPIKELNDDQAINEKQPQAEM